MRHRCTALQLLAEVGGSYYVGATKKISAARTLTCAQVYARELLSVRGSAHT